MKKFLLTILSTFTLIAGACEYENNYEQPYFWPGSLHAAYISHVNGKKLFSEVKNIYSAVHQETQEEFVSFGLYAKTALNANEVIYTNFPLTLTLEYCGWTDDKTPHYNSRANIGIFSGIISIADEGSPGCYNLPDHTLFSIYYRINGGEWILAQSQKWLLPKISKAVSGLRVNVDAPEHQGEATVDIVLCCGSVTPPTDEDIGFHVLTPHQTVSSKSYFPSYFNIPYSFEYEIPPDTPEGSFYIPSHQSPEMHNGKYLVYWNVDLGKQTPKEASLYTMVTVRVLGKRRPK